MKKTQNHHTLQQQICLQRLLLLKKIHVDEDSHAFWVNEDFECRSAILKLFNKINEYVSAQVFNDEKKKEVLTEFCQLSKKYTSNIERNDEKWMSMYSYLDGFTDYPPSYKEFLLRGYENNLYESLKISNIKIVLEAFSSLTQFQDKLLVESSLDEVEKIILNKSTLSLEELVLIKSICPHRFLGIKKLFLSNQEDIDSLTNQSFEVIMNRVVRHRQLNMSWFNEIYQKLFILKLNKILQSKEGDPYDEIKSMYDFSRENKIDDMIPDFLKGHGLIMYVGHQTGDHDALLDKLKFNAFEQLADKVIWKDLFLDDKELPDCYPSYLSEEMENLDLVPSSTIYNNNFIRIASKNDRRNNILNIKNIELSSSEEVDIWIASLESHIQINKGSFKKDVLEKCKNGFYQLYMSSDKPSLTKPQLDKLSELEGKIYSSTTRVFIGYMRLSYRINNSTKDDVIDSFKGVLSRFIRDEWLSNLFQKVMIIMLLGVSLYLQVKLLFWAPRLLSVLSVLGAGLYMHYNPKYVKELYRLKNFIIAPLPSEKLYKKMSEKLKPPVKSHEGSSKSAVLENDDNPNELSP